MHNPDSTPQDYRQKCMIVSAGREELVLRRDGDREDVMAKRASQAANVRKARAEIRHKTQSTLTSSH